jgi:Fe-S-cluster-containing hydrogenase component 2
MTTFSVDASKCNFCGLCVDECSPRLIVMDAPDSLPRRIAGAEELCNRCGHCVAVCPAAAVSTDTAAPQQCAPVARKLLPSAEQVETHVLAEVSLEIHGGEYVTIAGPSGSGTGKARFGCAGRGRLRSAYCPNNS